MSAPKPNFDDLEGFRTLAAFVRAVLECIDGDLEICFNYAPLFEDAVALFRPHALPSSIAEWHELRLMGLGHPANEHEFYAFSTYIGRGDARYKVSLTWEERPLGSRFAFHDLPEGATPDTLCIIPFALNQVSVYAQDPDERWEKPVWRNGHWCAQ